MEALDAEVIADSDFFIDLMRGKSGAANLAQELTREGTATFTTSVNAFELWLGAIKLGRKTATENLIKSVEILPLTRDSALLSAEIVDELSKKGMTLGYRDAFIAGIAKARGILTVVSRDEAFDRIEGIRTRKF